MAVQVEAFCSDGVRGGRILCEDCGQGFMAMEQQSKFYVLWAGIILLTLLILVDFTTLMLLGLALAIGGAAQIMLARRFPWLYVVDDERKSRLPTDETQAINPMAVAAGQSGGTAGADVASFDGVVGESLPLTAQHQTRGNPLQDARVPPPRPNPAQPFVSHHYTVVAPAVVKGGSTKSSPVIGGLAVGEQVCPFASAPSARTTSV